MGHDTHPAVLQMRGFAHHPYAAHDEERVTRRYATHMNDLERGVIHFEAAPAPSTPACRRAGRASARASISSHRARTPLTTEGRRAERSACTGRATRYRRIRAQSLRTESSRTSQFQSGPLPADARYA